MGLHCYYNEYIGKWVTESSRFFHREYDTEEQMRADYSDAYDTFTKALEAHSIVHRMLSLLRY